MIRVATWENARAGRFARAEPFFHGHKTHFIVSEKDARPSPQAYLLEQAPGFSVQAHFHSVPQFQVVAGGSGRIGSEPVAPFAVHFTGAHSPYGPIVAGTDGLWYFSLRATTNEGAFFMPESRGELRRDVEKAQITVNAPAVSSGGPRGELRSVACDTLFAPRRDGLAAWRMRLPPDAVMPSPESPIGGGRFYLVTGGEMQLAGNALARLSVAWVSPQDEPVRIAAARDGAEVLVLQFPRDAIA